MRLEIQVAPPFRFDFVASYLATSPSAIVETVVDGVYFRAFQAPGGVAVVRAAPLEDRLDISIDGPGADAAALDIARALVSRAFGLDAPVPTDGEIARIAERDPAIGRLLHQYRGLRPLTIPDPFEATIWAILGQQVNIAFAARMKRALVDARGRRVHAFGRVHTLFPEPSQLATLTIDEARQLQISRQKASYVAAIARAVVDGQFNFASLKDLGDNAAIAALTTIRGIGQWTAEYVLLRGLGRQDVFPAGDAGQRAALRRLYGLSSDPDEREMRLHAEAWMPWRGLVAFYLWFALQRGDVGAGQAIRSTKPSGTQNVSPSSARISTAGASD